jgi:hypothetical protein
MLVLILNTL